MNVNGSALCTYKINISSYIHVGYVVMKAQYVVFEYCSGTDLFSFLVTGPFERQKR